MPWGAVAAVVANELLADDPQPARATDVTPSEFRGLRGPVADQLRSFINTGGGPMAQGPFAAPLRPQEQTLLSDIFRSTRTPALTPGAQDTIGQTISGQFLDPASNPFLSRTIEAAQRPVVEQFQDVVMPRLRGDFTRAGQFIQQRPGTRPGTRAEGMSSPFDEAASRASRGLADALSDISTQIAGQNFQAERTRQQQAALAGPTIDAQTLERLTTGLQAQALPRLVEQFGIDRGLQEFQRRIQVLLTVIQSAGALGAPQTVTFEGTQGTNPAGPFLQGAGQAFGQQAGSSFFGGGG